jgi:hypothetical protein
MKNTLLILALTLITLSSINAQKWSVRYDANVLPTAASPAWTTKDSNVGSAVVDSSKYLKMNIIPGSGGKGDWNITRVLSNTTGCTSVFRVAASKELKDSVTANFGADWRIFEMETRNNALRDQFWILGRDSVYFAKSNGQTKFGVPSGQHTVDFHIYRLTFKNSVATLYFDENETPIATITDTGATTGKEWRMGNQSATIPGYGQYLDWVVCDTTGAFSPSQSVLPSDLATQIPNAVEDVQAKTNSYKLDQNYPNPFNPSTRISFNLEKTGYTELSVYNMLGQKVASLFSGIMAAGSHEFSFNASKFQSGVYVYQLKSGSFSQTRKMMLLK